MHTSPAPYGPQFMFCSRIVNDCCNCVRRACMVRALCERVSSFMNHLVEECDSPHLRAKSVILLSTKSTIDDLSVRRISICYSTTAARVHDNQIRSIKDATTTSTTTNHLQRNENAKKNEENCLRSM